MDIKLDDNGDVDLSSGDIEFLTDELEACKQRLRIKLKMFKGECFFATDEGMPYYQSLLVKNPKLTAVTAIFRKAILSDPAVSEVPTITAEVNATLRSVSLSFSAILVTGQTLTFDRFLVSE